MQEVNNATDSVRNHNVGKSDYAKHKIQPWDVWIEFQLNPFDADLVKRTLRTKAEGGMTKSEARKLDYEKIIHISSERVRQIETGVTWPTTSSMPSESRVDEIIEEYKLSPRDANILKNLLIKKPDGKERIKQYGMVMYQAKKGIESLTPVIAKEKKQAENEAKMQDKSKFLIEKAEKTAKEALKKISDGMSTYKQLSKSMESLLQEIDSKDQIDMFNN